MITNQFRIRLKYDRPLPQEMKVTLEDRFDTLMSDGFGNYFGEQRFGVSKQNHRIAQDILEGGRAHLSLSEKMFKLQAYASRLFNNYLSYRLKKYGTIDLLEGDILFNPVRQNYLLAKTHNLYEIADRKNKAFFVSAKPLGKPLPAMENKQLPIT